MSIRIFGNIFPTFKKAELSSILTYIAHMLSSIKIYTTHDIYITYIHTYITYIHIYSFVRNRNEYKYVCTHYL